MQRPHADGRLRRDGTAAGTEYVGGSGFELRLSRSHLVGMHVELLGKLRQGSITLDGSQRHLRLEGRCVVPTMLIRFLDKLRSSRYSSLVVGAQPARTRNLRKMADQRVVRGKLQMDSSLTVNFEFSVAGCTDVG